MALARDTVSRNVTLWAGRRGEGGRMIRSAIIAVLVGSLVGVAAYATIVPFDFTGHWTGTAQQEGQPANPLMADFTSTGPKTFTGTVMADEPCTARGKAKRHMKVAVRMDCSGGRTVKVRGRIDSATQTMEGTF